MLKYQNKTRSKNNNSAKTPKFLLKFCIKKKKKNEKYKFGGKKTNTGIKGEPKRLVCNFVAKLQKKDRKRSENCVKMAK